MSGRGRHGARGAMIAAVLCVIGIGALLALRNAVVDAPLERLARTVQGDRAVYEGSWHFPRGGPYILGFASPGPARLAIDGRRVAAGQGQQLGRHVFEAGTRAVRFEVPAGQGDARLLWHPPGRRGPPEYVPPSSLAPAPPAQARFGAWAGASPVDGVIAALIALILVALCLYLGRHVLARVDRRGVLAFAAVAGVALAVRLLDLGGAGQTWDEDVNWSAGRNYVTNWLALDFAPGSWTWNYEHPPVMKYIAGIGAQWADGYGPARALSALLVALGCALLVPIGRRLYGLPAGVLAGVIAALSPHLVAHGKIVGHEAPTVLLWTLAIWLALRAHDPLGAESESESEAKLESEADPLPRRLAVLGVIVGLAVFSRFVNALLAPLVGAILLISVPSSAPPGRRWRTMWLGLVIMVPVIAAVGFAVWPRLWPAPIEHLHEAWLKLRKPHGPEPFLGHITSVPPRYYFAVYLGATAPVGVLAAAALGLVRAAVRRGAERRATATLALWLAVPMLVLLSPVRQDGVRYIMPCLLALALVAAAGIDFVAGWLATRIPARRARIMAALGTAMGLYLAVACVRIHPYYLDYYGEHVGGPAGVARQRTFELAWWGEGIADAIDYVNRHARPRARVHKRCVGPSHLTWLRADLWATEARDPGQADWIVVYHPAWGTCPLPPDVRLVHEVTAQGAPLVHVYHVDRRVHQDE